MIRVMSTLRQFRPSQTEIGGFDRVHDGLISGWFACSTCDAGREQPLHLFLNGQCIDAEFSAFSRSDVPRGQGFLFRFPLTDQVTPRVQIRCSAHPRRRLQLNAPREEWSVTALAAIETLSWPRVTGWLVSLDPNSYSEYEILIDNYPPIPLRGTLTRRDVETYIGTGVRGFQLDLGSVLNNELGQALHIALPDGTPVTLVHSGRPLDTTEITDSPLGPHQSPCLAERRAAAPVRAKIQRRFLEAEVDADGDWRALLTRLGMQEHGIEAEQWANYLTHRGANPQEVAAWLTLRSTHLLAANSLSPLPSSLDDLIDPDTASECVRYWSESVLRPAAHSERTLPIQTTAAPPRVAVAGLINHPSGLGQNARNSLRALDAAGFHACAAPFFPGPGGWNPSLVTRGEMITFLDEHAVLLHVPIDRVIPSLCAQPGLLTTDRLIGYFMWETEVIPQQFIRALDVVDEIWTATEFVADAFRTVTGTPVHVTGHVVETSGVAHVERSTLNIPEDAFVVHYAFDANSTVARKNPSGAIDAFVQAFDGDPSAVFVLKVRNMQQVDGLARSGDRHSRGLLERLERHPSIRLITGEHGRSYALGLIEMSDCFLSLHRSEGYGYGIAEAMALGTPVIATDYSGITDLANRTNACLVPYEEVEVAPGEYFYWEPGMTWAAPDIASGAKYLSLVREGQIPDTGAARKQIDRHASLTSLSAAYAAGLLMTSNGGA